MTGRECFVEALKYPIREPRELLEQLEVLVLYLRRCSEYRNVMKAARCLLFFSTGMRG